MTAALLSRECVAGLVLAAALTVLFVAAVVAEHRAEKRTAGGER